MLISVAVHEAAYPRPDADTLPAGGSVPGVPRRLAMSHPRRPTFDTPPPKC